MSPKVYNFAAGPSKVPEEVCIDFAAFLYSRLFCCPISGHKRLLIELMI